MRLTVLAAALVGLSLWSAAPKLSASAPEQSPLPAPATQAAPPAAAPSDLDAFMSKVLARRSEAWRNLHDYILSERERFELTGPNDLRLYGTKREFTWFVRGGYLIRSPVRFDGVAPGDRERHEYEERWLREEQAREKHQEEKAKEASEKDAKKEGEAAGDAGATPADLTGEPAGDTASLVGKGLEPRFISEAYFMQFKFDPGNYYLAGRETLDGRNVLRIEYYPTRLFQEDEKKPERETETRGASSTEVRADRSSPQAGPAKDGRRKKDDHEKDLEEEYERKFNKVALVTLWVDPAEHQIVKYTFDNTDLNFLPGRWFVRVSDISASMTMGQYFQGVWLPRAIGVHASLTFANGTYDAEYGRDFFDYRQGEVKARIRSYSPKEN